MTTNIKRFFLLTIVLALCTVMAKAQFKIVDELTRQPLQGVYVFSESGTLLTMSDANGMVKALNETVTLSVLTYESLTIDAKKQKGEVAMKEKTFELPEVVVGKTEFMKISATFRDVVTNFDGVVLYREGLADYYYNTKTKKYNRYIRACRQYEHPDLRKHINDSLAMMITPLLDFNKLNQVERTGVASVHGDTTVMMAKFGKKTVSDGVKNIEKDGTYRVLIDNTKFLKRNSVSMLGMLYTLKKHITDWQYSDKPFTRENIVAMRTYREEEIRWSKKAVVVPVTTTSDFVVNSITNLTKKEAKEEMKDKGTTTDFALPDCLPAIPQSVKSQAKKLTLKRFRR